MTTPTLELEPGTFGSQGRFRLTVIAGPHRGMSWTFECPVTLTIGREAPAHLVLDREPALSRRHWRLQCNGTQIQLHDDESRNGTLVNGLRVIDASLKNGDRFGIGQTELSLEILSQGGQPAPAPAEPTSVPSDSGTREATKERKATPDFTSVKPPSIEQTKVRHAISPSKSPAAEDDNIVKTKVAASSTDHAQLAETVAPRSGSGVPGEADFQIDSRTSKDRSGEQVGSYTLSELLGSGGMADVYKATRRSDGQIVAIKFLRLDIQAKEKQLQLFKREAGTILQLDHPRIVRGIEFGVQEDTPFLVLEFIPTLNLLELIDSQPLEQKIRTSLWIVRRVLATTDYLHKRKFIHRDIKPSNLLAYREAHRLKIKLADFGLAKLAENAGSGDLTDDKSIRGTLSFMSPQQFRNSRRSGPSDDLFSIGACLYRFLVGRNPNVLFAAQETMDFLINANLPDPLTNVVLKSIAHQSGDRFRKSESFLKALEPFGANKKPL